jgi:hypothetical protein
LLFSSCKYNKKLKQIIIIKKYLCPRWGEAVRFKESEVDAILAGAARETEAIRLDNHKHYCPIHEA